MIGKRITGKLSGLSLAGLIALSLLINTAHAEKIEYAFPDDPGVVSEPGMMEVLSKFRSQMGWNESVIEREDGSTLMVLSGIGVVNAPRSSANFVNSRQIAFDKAMLDAKAQLVEILGTSISGQLKNSYSEPSQARQSEKLERQRNEGLMLESAERMAQAKAGDMKENANSQAESTAIDEAMNIVELALDNRLKDLGFDPNQPVDQQTLQKVTQEEQFQKLIRAAAKSRVVGLQPFKVFENYNDGEQGEIGVVAVWSPKLAATAKAIYSGNLNLLPKMSASKKSFDQQVPDETRVLLSSFGAKQVIGPNGEVGILAFAQAAPRHNNRRSINAAYEKAKLAAMFNIRQFAGEVAAVESMRETSETATSYADGMEDYQYDEAYQRTIEAKAEEIKISGLSTIKFWNGTHPISQSPVAGAVVLWNPSTATAAQGVENSMNNAGTTPDSGIQRDADPYGGGEYSGSSPAADLDSF